MKNIKMDESAVCLAEEAITRSGDEARFSVDAPIGSFHILMAFHVPADVHIEEKVKIFGYYT